MGSPYLMAHGWGTPVEDAVTQITVPETGTYQVFLRTFNWTSPWFDGEGQGRIKLIINGKELVPVLGNSGNHWMWQDAGLLNLKKGNQKLSCMT